MSRFLVTGFPRFSSSALANRALARFWAGVWACDSEKVSFAEKSLGVETHHCDGGVWRLLGGNCGRNRSNLFIKIMMKFDCANRY